MNTPTAALPSAASTRYRFRDFGLGCHGWRVVDSTVIRDGSVEAIHLGVEQLDFDNAIDLAHRFREEADLAYARRNHADSCQWIAWAEELERYAAGQRPAPGRVWRGGIDCARGADRTARFFVRRSAVHACEQVPSFAEMTRRGQR